MFFRLPGTAIVLCGILLFELLLVQTFPMKAFLWLYGISLPGYRE
jgi:hypothetical protein